MSQTRIQADEILLVEEGLNALFYYTHFHINIVYDKFDQLACDKWVRE